jgi:hypothetical protein
MRHRVSIVLFLLLSKIKVNNTYQWVIGIVPYYIWSLDVQTITKILTANVDMQQLGTIKGLRIV